MYKHNFHPSILREYDIRGVVGNNINQNKYIFLLKLFDKAEIINVEET